MASIQIRIMHGENTTTIVIDSQISKGGMGEVFRGRIVGPDGYEKPVAIKKIAEKFGRKPEFKSQFFKEAKLGALLNHPSIVQNLAYGEDSAGELYLVMELFDHPNLKIALTRSTDAGVPFSDAAVLKIIKQISDALQFLHSSKSGGSVIHRDLSPSNILIDPEYRIKLIDFGVSLSRNPNDSPTAETPGKLLYTAPELLKKGAADERSDLYSLGVIAFELCNGFHPFQGADSSNLIAKIESGPAWDRLRHTDEDLKKLIDSLLNSDLSQRPKSAKTVYRTCKNLSSKIGEPISEGTVPDIDVHQGEKSPSRKWTTFLASAIAVGIAVAAFILMGKAKTTIVANTNVDGNYFPIGGDPKLTLKDGGIDLNIGPSVDAKRFSIDEKSQSKFLTSSACQIACEPLWGTIEAFVGESTQPWAEVIPNSKDGLKLFLTHSRQDVINSKSRIIRDVIPNCPHHTICLGALTLSGWLTEVFSKSKFESQLSSFNSLGDVRKFIKREDPGGAMRKRYQDLGRENVNQMGKTHRLSEYFSVQSFHQNSNQGLQVVSVNNGKGPLDIMDCKSIGDEVFGAVINPTPGPFDRFNRGDLEKPAELNLLILPENNLLKIINATADSINFRWFAPTLAAQSEIFSKGICHYSRRGTEIREISQWTPRISEIVKPQK